MAASRGPPPPAEIRRRLADERPILDRYDGGRLAVFGSVARGDSRPGSDLDMLVEFRHSPTFDNYMGLVEFLESLFGCHVDLVTPGAVKPRMAPVLRRDAVDVA